MTRMEKRTAVVINKKWTGRGKEYLYSYYWYLIERYGKDYFEIMPKEDPIGFRAAAGYYKIVVRCYPNGEWGSSLHFQNGTEILEQNEHWIKLARKAYGCE